MVGAPDEERGQIVEAHVVLREGMAGDEACVKRLQDHVKATIAPYKYPRSVKFVAALPKTQTGKIQRFKLKREQTSIRSCQRDARCHRDAVSERQSAPLAPPVRR